MTQDATSESTDTTSATEDNTTQEVLPGTGPQQGDGTESSTDKGAKPAAKADDELGDSGKRALQEERKARRDAEKQLKDLNTRLQQFEDSQKTELQKAIERAEAAEKGATSMRVANARLMAAATHNLPADLIDILGDGTEEEIDARAKLLAEKLAGAAPKPDPQADPKPASTRPVESLTPGAKPASQPKEDPDAWLRALSGRGG